MSVAQHTAEAARAFLASLDDRQSTLATAPFGTPDHRAWTYLPGDRPGLSMVDMTTGQQELALALLDSGCSSTGARTARGVIELDRIRRLLSSGDGDLDGDRFWVRVLGKPGEVPWAWRVNGHHLAVHVTVVGDEIAVTPNFFGAEPATVLTGPHAGRRTLIDEEELARDLLAEMDPGRRKQAVTSPTAPHDILTRRDPVADPALLPSGLSYADMTDSQRTVLRRLIRTYLDRAPADVADESWRAAELAGVDELAFAWAGSAERGQGHYYCVRGPTLLIEYDNTQDDANHIHSVWRDPQRDWGADLLAEHYAASHT